MDMHLDQRTSDRKSPKPFSIRLDPIPVNEQVVYIESVCAALIDSRFGPGRSRPIVIDVRGLPGPKDQIFFEMTPHGPVPCYEILSDSEMARRYSNEIIRDELARREYLDSVQHFETIRMPNLGRGSPRTSNAGQQQKPGSAK